MTSLYVTPPEQGVNTLSMMSKMFRLSTIKRLLMVVITALPGVVAAGGNTAPVVELSDQDIQQRLQRIERRLDNQSLLDLYNQVQRLQDQVQQLQGELDSQRHVLDQMAQRQMDLYADIDQRLQELSGNGADSAEGGDEFGVDEPLPVDDSASADADSGGDELAVQSGGDTAGDTASLSTNGQAASTAYNKAFDLLKAGKYQEASGAFNQYLKNYPDGEYADNAQYWLGESYYVTRNFEEAVAAYRRVIDMYPDSQKVPHAMLKIGYSQQELGEAEQARQTLQDLRSQYPNSTAASLAQERLQQMQAAGS